MMDSGLLYFVFLSLVTLSCDGCSPCDYDLVTGPYGVSDEAITASSIHSHCALVEARFSTSNSWCPLSTGSGHYLQVEFGSVSLLKAIKTRGRGLYDQWVTSYSVNISMDGHIWKSIKDASGHVKVFPGNVDRNTVMTNALEGTVIAKYIRVISVSIQIHGSMMLEVEGCPFSEVNRTCSRWEAKLGSTGDILPVLMDTDVSNQGLCCLKCFKHMECDSFLFDVTSARCRLLKVTMDGPGVTVNLDGVWYFVKILI